VHVPVVGRLWRQHGENGSKQFTHTDFDGLAEVFGFEGIGALRDEVFSKCTF
jgi:hypothetical protein